MVGAVARGSDVVSECLVDRRLPELMGQIVGRIDGLVERRVRQAEKGVLRLMNGDRNPFGLPSKPIRLQPFVDFRNVAQGVEHRAHFGLLGPFLEGVERL